jgi:hypothetical protein
MVERRQSRAVMMAELRRAGVEHTASMPSADMEALYNDVAAPRDAPARDPLDHDGNGRKGGSKPRAKRA